MVVLSSGFGPFVYLERSSLIFAFLINIYSFLIGAGASRMYGRSDPFGGRSPNGHVNGRHGCSLLIRLLP